MAQLRQDYPKFVERSAQVIAVGPEDLDTFSYFWRQERMPFIGIPDPKHVVANLYGQKVDPFKLGRMPALMVVDKSSKLRYRHYGSSMSDIPTNKEILSLLDELNNEQVISKIKVSDVENNEV
jgi:peroxiredoxin